MRVLCLSQYDASGPSSRYRMYQYFPLLRAAGVQIDEAPLLDRSYVTALYAGARQNRARLARAMSGRLSKLLRARSYDVVWVEKELLPYAPAVLERLLRATGARLVVDYDDAVFHRYDLHPRAAVRALLGRKIDAVMRSAALVVAGNAYLADRARAAGAARVEVLPTVIDLDRYPPQPSSPREVLTVGWIGSPATQGYLQELAPTLARFCAEHGARVQAIGARADLSMPGVPLEVVRWTEAGEVSALHALDVGIMPLPDSPWERGKCGLKLIQYMGCGRPVIASPVGANRAIVVDGETGLFAATPDQWLAALRALAASAETRARMGAAGRARAAREYSLAAAAPRLLAMLRNVAERSPAIALASGDGGAS